MREGRKSVIWCMPCAAVAMSLSNPRKMCLLIALTQWRRLHSTSAGEIPVHLDELRDSIAAALSAILVEGGLLEPA